MTQAYPYFYVVGGQKCATTTLYALLRQHTGVFLPDMKESHFFSLPEPEHHYTDYAAERMNRTTIRSEEEYLALFRPTGEQLSGEICPTYLYSDVAADRIAAVRPDAKIILLLRDPPARSFSAYRHMQAGGAETATTFDEALALEEAHKRDGWQAMSHYVSASLYAAQVQRYYARFPREQILVMTFEVFTKDPVQSANRILDFIGLPPLPEEAKLQQTNKTLVVRNKFVSDVLVHQKFGMEYLRKLLPKKTRGRVKEKVLGLFASAPEKLSPETRKKLMRRFAPDIEELQQITEYTFDEWGHNDRAD